MTLMSKRLLIVDDNSINVELLLDLLDDHGFDHVQGISDPRQVLGLCQQQLPDLILLDIRMPYLLWGHVTAAGALRGSDAASHRTDRPDR
ncbi:response regulator [Vreelandella hamiltonii]|uniref:Response regulatory domain-containing protein n=1 Tax=Halomonas johnsoniae TaxID=502832 RepID=A0ABQ2WLB2_9GAMM|nr:hypothetical protein GCM10007158_22780 [Halomonas johnsoniae]